MLPENRGGAEGLDSRRRSARRSLGDDRLDHLGDPLAVLLATPFGRAGGFNGPERWAGAGGGTYPGGVGRGRLEITICDLKGRSQRAALPWRRTMSLPTKGLEAAFITKTIDRRHAELRHGEAGSRIVTGRVRK